LTVGLPITIIIIGKDALLGKPIVAKGREWVLPEAEIG
jgi:hypothetical protein